MKLAVWPVAPAQALAAALAASGRITETVAVEPYAAATALREGRVDLTLVPTLAVLRDPEAFSLVPGVGLVGARCPTVQLVVAGPLDAVETVTFDPRFTQEVLLTQLLLREHYGATPAFLPADPTASLDARLAGRDAALVAADVPVGEGPLVLDLGQEWVDLTLRPLVWGLLAARPGTLDAETAEALAAAVAAAPPVDDDDRAYQLTLDGYAHAGLDELVNYLYYHRVLDDLPVLPFVMADEA